MTNSGAKPHKAKKKTDRSDFIAFCGQDFPLSSSPQSSSPSPHPFHLDLKCSWSHLIIFFVLALQEQRFMVWAVHSKIYFLFFAKALKCSKVSCFDGTSKQNEWPFHKMCRSRTFNLFHFFPCSAVLCIVFCTLGCPVKYEHQSHIFLIQGFTMRVRDAPYGAHMWPKHEQIATFCVAKIQS